jgi:beta-1,4-mannosyltransferase
MIIDWHNFGFTVLALSLHDARHRHWMVRFSRWYEGFFARRADGHLCVTNAMRMWMAAQWGIR